MKLYLSSYRIPTPDDLSKLLNKPLKDVSVALITNAKDYYAERPKQVTVGALVEYMEQLGLQVTILDLREYDNTELLKATLAPYDLLWAMGGNTYMLRYEMKRSGFDTIIRDLLMSGVVYGGDSAGALVAGMSIAGVESADEPAFAEEIITDGLQLVPYVILPHVDNPEFAEVLPVFETKHHDKEIIQLKDSQAVVFDGDRRVITEAKEQI